MKFTYNWVYFSSALFYILTNLLLGISAVLLVYLWAAKVRVSKAIQSPDVLLMTLVYDAGQSYLPFTQLWPALAFIAFTLSGFCSMVSNSKKFLSKYIIS